MASFAGSALTVTWTYGATTHTLSGDFRTFTTTPGVDLYEDTAGADADKTYLPGVRSGQASFTSVLQSGSLVVYGTALKEGYLGTLKYYPEGNAAGKFVGTVPAICMGMVLNQPYNNIVELSVTWTRTGAESIGTA